MGCGQKKTVASFLHNILRVSSIPVALSAILRFFSSTETKSPSVAQSAISATATEAELSSELIKPTRIGNPTETKPISSNESSKEMSLSMPMSALTAFRTMLSGAAFLPIFGVLDTDPGQIMFWKKVIIFTQRSVRRGFNTRSTKAPKIVTKPTTKKNSSQATGSGCGLNQ